MHILLPAEASRAPAASLTCRRPPINPAKAY